MKRICTALAALAVTLPAAAQQFTMKLSCPTVNDMNVEYMKAMKAGIEPKSGGRIKVDLYPANQLGQIPRTVEGVALGTIEMTLVASGFFIGMDPRYLVFDAAGLFDDMDHGNRVFQDPQIRKRLASFSADKGIEPLIVYNANPNMVVSHKAIRTLADFKGQKIRVPGSPLQIEPLKRFGASPLSMPFGEVLPALQNRTIDGVWAGTTLFTALKFYDIAKTMTYLPSHWAATVPLANRNFMKSLGPDLEKIVREEARKADQQTYVWAAQDIKRSEKIWADNGGKEIRLSAAEQKRFLDESIAADLPHLTATPQAKEDYEAFAAAAKKYRQ
jgi:TRAP-type C4-dicarboxylate transport system substrate-binding protein